MPAAVVVIPARYASTRFPGKPLALLAGRPLILHVLEGAQRARLPERVIVATDDERILRAVRGAGGEAVMTRDDHPSGTDRVAEVAAGLDCDIIVNIQGDEPFIRGDVIDGLIRTLEDDVSADMVTLVARIRSLSEALDPNVVKVVRDRSDRALYFSRSPIPFYRDAWAGPGGPGAGGLPEDSRLYKHIGIYGYRREALLRLSRAAPCETETAERLEQLRALDLGMTIRVRETEHEAVGVDTPEDLARAEAWRNTSS